MKRTLILSAAFFGFATASQAQSTNTDNVTLNVKLNPIQTLIVNQSQKEVNLEYTTVAQYANGVSAAQADHLKIYSTGGFQVKVKSSGSELTTSKTGPAGNINANTIQIVPTAGTKAVSNAQYTASPLSADEKVIVSATTGGVDKSVNIEYKGAGADAYINNYVAGQNPTKYTTTVTYTIIAQ
ncbi:hypothetical protein [Niabella aquatica]